jgi:methionyl-tRNA formyltransferase
LRLTPSAVKALAQVQGFPVLQPASLRDPAARAEVTAVPLDVLVVAAYGLILPRDVLTWPRHGCVNIHASKLPRWRGAAPIQRAIEAGDAATGITIMQMDEGLDTGPVIAMADVPIAAGDTAGTLHDKLADAGACVVVDVLAGLARDGRLDATPQPREGVTYAAKVGPADTAVDWRRSAAAIERKLRALDPSPGADARFAGEPLKLRAGKVIESAKAAPPGTLIAVGDSGIDVATGDGAHALRVTELQPAGGKRMSAAAFLRGRAWAPGARFDAAG